MNLGKVSDESLDYHFCWMEEGRSFMIMQSCDSETWTNCWNLRTRMPNAENHHWIWWHVKVADPFKIEDDGRIRNKQRLNLMLDMFLSSFKRLKREDMFFIVGELRDRENRMIQLCIVVELGTVDRQWSVERVGKKILALLHCKEPRTTLNL
jgi:hypothetical protein